MSAQPTAPLRLVTPPTLRLVPAPRSAPPYDDEVGAAPLLRLVTAGVSQATPATTDDPWLAAARTPTSALPSADAFARTLVQGLLEVLAGVRAIKQLQRDTTPELYEKLTARIARRRYATGNRPDHAAVRSVHVQERPEGVVEVCATVVRGPRMGALALRLEGLDGRWRCTELMGV